MTTARARLGGFTLIELLLAAAIFAMLSAALFSVFHGAMQLRENAAETFAQDRPNQYAASLMERDLRNMLPPAGVLAGDMVGENNEEAGRSLDTLVFFATTGVVVDSLPWGDVQQITYSLEEPEEEADENEGYDLVRLAERNLLASTQDGEDEEDAENRLLKGVASLDFSYFDGEEWQDSWDSSVQENALPEAIRVQIDLVEPGKGERARHPIEVICEIVCASTASETTTTGGGAI